MQFDIDTVKLFPAPTFNPNILNVVGPLQQSLDIFGPVLDFGPARNDEVNRFPDRDIPLAGVQGVQCFMIGTANQGQSNTQGQFFWGVGDDNFPVVLCYLKLIGLLHPKSNIGMRGDTSGILLCPCTHEVSQDS